LIKAFKEYLISIFDPYIYSWLPLNVCMLNGNSNLA
jgi:hypothetical protein